MKDWGLRVGGYGFKIKESRLRVEHEGLRLEGGWCRVEE